MGKVLLAKSEPQTTLFQHTKDVLTVWEKLQVSFPLAKTVAEKENFWILLKFAIITHDLGKSHSEFQKILEGQESEWHEQRHELFSLSFAAAISALNNDDKKIVMRVVAGHHRSYDRLRSFIASNYEDNNQEFDDEFSKLIQKEAIKIANTFERSLLPDKIPALNPKDLIVEYRREVKKAKRKEKEQYYHTLLLLIGAFFQSDHLASGFITDFPNLGDSNFLFLQTMVQHLKNKGNSLYSHQQIAAKTLGSTILTAPTGSGKTEASLLWLKHQLNETGQGRTFYILPFTASINAMFERLSDDKYGLGHEMVGMVHGKLNAYLYDKLFEDARELQTLKDKIKIVKQQFKTLQTPVKVLTPFQLLKHLFGLKGFEKGMFEWVGGYFIFDEIHAYDPEVTAQIIILLEFLSKEMQAKIFIMTATLPTFLKQLIREAIGSYSEIKANEHLYSSFKRHKLELRKGLLANNYTSIESALNDGKKVLVVCNTVDSSRLVFDEFKTKHEALLIHGRFAAVDRNRIEKTLRTSQPNLLIGTQAIEVSLDIDYDIIFSEPAPLDALIQRFGRVNRKRKKQPCTCIVFLERNENDKYIYDEDIISRTFVVLKTIESMDNGIISEMELQKYIDIVYPSFSESAQDKYDKVYQNLKGHLQRLYPFLPSKDGEQEYYSQFDGVKVVPAYYDQKYRQLLEDFDFIGAEQLKVSLRKSRFAQFFHSSGELEKDEIAVTNPQRQNAAPIVINYFRLNKKYDPETGLDFNETQYMHNSDDSFL